MASLDGDEDAEFELGVAYAAQQCTELLLGGAPGIHFYALNKAPATHAVLSALRAARPWEHARPGSGDGQRRRRQLRGPASLDWRLRWASSPTRATASPTTSTGPATGRSS